MKKIEIVFENCEWLEINADITFDILPVPTEGTDKCDTIDNVIISIPKEENGVYYPFGYIEDETTKFNRLFSYNDITQIVVDSNTYFPRWYQENEYEWVQSNKYQKTNRDSDGNLTISISKRNNAKPLLSKLPELTDIQKFLILKSLELYKNNTIDKGLEDALAELITIMGTGENKELTKLDRIKLALRSDFLETVEHLTLDEIEEIDKILINASFRMVLE